METSLNVVFLFMAVIVVRYVISLLFSGRRPPPASKQRCRVKYPFSDLKPLMKPPVQLGEISEEELKAYDGSDYNKPLLFAIDSQIFDVTSAWERYGPGGKYDMFAGKDVSIALVRSTIDGECSGDDRNSYIKRLYEREYAKVGTINKPEGAAKALPNSSVRMAFRGVGNVTMGDDGAHNFPTGPGSFCDFITGGDINLASARNVPSRDGTRGCPGGSRDTHGILRRSVNFYKKHRFFLSAPGPKNLSDCVLVQSLVPMGGGLDNKELILVRSDYFNITMHDLLGAKPCTSLGRSVYKCCLMKSKIVVVVKNLQSVTLSWPEFREKINRVAVMDHPNLLSIGAYCYTEEFKFILYDYAPSGSLYDLLHSGGVSLTIADRLAIALGVAQGIEYFHTHADKTSHGNIKSANILITTGLQVHVLAHGLPSTSDRFTAYRAPEVTDPYKVSQEADVYSFGVLLLELLTRRNPNRLIPVSDDVYIDAGKSYDLVGWVKLMVERHEHDSVSYLGIYYNNNNDDVELSQIKGLLILAANCVAHDPSKRPTMSVVRRQIMQLKLQLC